jgi:hypothetical protein
MTSSDLRGIGFADWPRWGEPPQPPSHALQPRVQSLTDNARQVPWSRLQERTDPTNATSPTLPPGRPEPSRLDVSSSESGVPPSPNGRSTLGTEVPRAPAFRVAKPPEGSRALAGMKVVRRDLLSCGKIVIASLDKPLLLRAKPSG